MKRIFIIIISIFFTISINSQNLVDKLNDYEKRNYSKGIKYNIDSLKYYAIEMQASKNPCTAVLGKFIEANNYYKTGNYKKSEAICLAILSEIKSINNDCQNKNKYRIYERLFWINKNTNRYKEAFDYLILKESISKSFIKDTKFYLKKLANEYSKALIKSELGFYNEAITILKNAIKEAEFIKPKTEKEKYYIITHKSSAYNILGDTYIKKSKNKEDQNLDLSLIYYKKAYETALNFNPPHKDTDYLFNLRKIKVLLKKEDYKNSLTIVQDLNSEENLKLANLNQDLNLYKSIIYFNLKQSDSTLYYAHRFLNYQQNTPNTKVNLIKVYDILAQQYDILQQKDSAYKFSRLGLNEVSELNEHKTKINKLHYLHNFNEVNSKNDLVINSKRKNHVIQIIIIASLFIIFISLLYLWFNKNRKLNKQEYDEKLDEFKSSEAPPKKDYNIEKELEETIIEKLNDLENSTEFLNHNFTLKEFAQKLNTNTTYISYIINNSKNQSFKQYITKLRIDYLIKKLNSDTKYHHYTIQYLAEEIGYTNASAFTRVFKKELGITPSEYLKSIKKT